MALLLASALNFAFLHKKTLRRAAYVESYSLLPQSPLFPTLCGWASILPSTGSVSPAHFSLRSLWPSQIKPNGHVLFSLYLLAALITFAIPSWILFFSWLSDCHILLISCSLTGHSSIPFMCYSCSVLFLDVWMPLSLLLITHSALFPADPGCPMALYPQLELLLAVQTHIASSLPSMATWRPYKHLRMNMAQTELLIPPPSLPFPQTFLFL